MNIIDAHQHFWQFDPKRDTWMTPGIMEKIRKDFLPEDLEVIMKRLGISGTIAVQADQSEAETSFLLGLADQHPSILGVVGWLDLKDPEITQNLAKWSRHQKLVGLRHILQAEPPGFMSDPDFQAGLEQLSRFGFTYDLLIYWHQMDEAIAMIEDLPDLKIVLDHIGKPDIRDGRILKWSKGLKKLAEMPNVCCKISGLVTEAHWQYWQPEDFLPYLDLVFEYFGPQRCMFGSDWPVSTLASTYQDWFEFLINYLNKFSPGMQQAVLADNCRSFYNLPK